jgi:multiple sugar transport system substrate-binding protein
MTQTGYAQFVRKYPGIGVWVQNLKNALQSRPVATTYPKISTVVGQAVQSVLLGKAQPQQALSSAAQQVNGILAAPS